MGFELPGDLGAGADQILHVTSTVLATLGIEARQLQKGHTGLAQLGRQLQKLTKLVVTHFNHKIGVDIADALVHIADDRFEQGRLARQLGLAVSQLGGARLDTLLQLGTEFTQGLLAAARNRDIGIGGDHAAASQRMATHFDD